jgi:hypothetical protein
MSGMSIIYPTFNIKTFCFPLGLLCAGALVGRLGFAATATLYTVIGLVLTILIAIRWRGEIWVTRDR